MGIYSDFLAHTSVVDVIEPQVGPQRVAYNELVRLRDQNDPEPAPGFDVQNEIQVIEQFSGTVNSGNYTLTIVTPAGTELTTANIAFDANAATIKSAIDTACSGIAGWTNGDISVNGGPLTSNDVTLIFDGSSVEQQNFGQTIITDIDLGGGGSVGDVSTTQHGQPKRYTWAVMQELGMVSTPPEYGTPWPGNSVLEISPGETSFWPSPALLKALAWQAAIDDDNPALRDQLERLFHIQ